MALGIRLKLLAGSLGLILLTVGAVRSYLSHVLERDRMTQLEDGLTTRLALIEPTLLLRRDALGDIQAMDALADELGRRSHARVTLLSPKGEVWGDSEVPVEGVKLLAWHGDRPEFRKALEVGDGKSIRPSATVAQEMIYAARAIHSSDGELLMVARVAVPAAGVEQALDTLKGPLLSATALAIVAAVLLSQMAAHLASRPLRELIGAALRMAGGDLATRTFPRGDDEAAQLGKALNHLAESLSSTLSELRAERDLLQGMLVSMQEGVLMLDGLGAIVLVNPALREMLLLGPNVTGEAFENVVHHEELKRLLDTAMSADSPTLGEVELAGLKPRRLLVRAISLRGEPGGLLAVFVDVTDVRRLESLRRDFVSNASHELRTPVSSILSASETLRDMAVVDPKASAQFVDIIFRNAERLKRLVDDLLELSRIESREFQLNREIADPTPTIQHAASLFRERAEKKKIRLQLALPPEPIRISFDRQALEAVLSNLIDNAVKYCPEGSSIVVRATIEGRSLRISVEDTGPGIESKHLARLFERFYRVDAGRSREVGGT
ncbi:MAG: cell wall metabolism sensor histidine kinase WalK, partial [Polyangiaceae bacterium]|nr:cell wall metabolism sensor histidine kinase WalK [Polyangiaceae bacterium]